MPSIETYLHIFIGIFASLVVVIIPGFFFIRRFLTHVSQLSYQNSLLRALRHLDEVALSTNDLEPLCQQIVNVIQQELGYFFGAIALVDSKSNVLRRIAISKTPLIESVLQKMPIPYSRQVVSLDNKDNLLVRSIKERKNESTFILYDIQVGIYPPEISNYLQKTLNMKEFFIYPLRTKDKVLGVIYYCTTVPRAKFSKFEFDIMNNFSREVARVLENILLYHNLSEATQRLSKANQKLEELDQLKDDFVSVASHELRTPMTVIRSYAWMALNRSGMELSVNLQKYIARILISTERLINLVNDMLNISRIEAGSIEINPRPIDLSLLIKDIVDEVYYSKDPSKNLEFILSNQRLPLVFADPDKLRQVVLNLMSNAMKFSPKGGRIFISFFSDGRVVETAVRDQGPGISAEDMMRLFTKFGRLDNSYTATATSGGTGLGLYISKRLIELMHGRVWATSQGLGKGATFTFALPVATQEVVKEAEKYRIIPQGEVKSLEPVPI